MSELQTFVNDELGKYIRSIVIDDQPWFVGKDVAVALGYANHRDALSKHVDEEDKRDGVAIRDSIGRDQNPTMINESGVYSLVFGSKLESARKFKRWVTSEVLPTIRKRGVYGDFDKEYRLKCAAILAKTPVKSAKTVAEMLGFEFKETEYYKQREAKKAPETNIPDDIANYFDSIQIPHHTPTRKLYEDYVEWCNNNGEFPITKIEFSRKLVKYTNRPIIDKKVNGTKTRVIS